MTSGNMTTLPIDVVAPGARLAANVLGTDGRVLMTAGGVLSAAALAQLSRLGIVSVAVEAATDAVQSNAAEAALRARLAHLFRACPPDAGGDAKLLFQVVLAHRLEDLQ